MRCGEEKQHNGEPREESADRVPRCGYPLTSIWKEISERVVDQHVKRCPRWVTHLHLRKGGDKFRAVPYTRTLLHRHEVDRTTQHKEQPPKAALQYLISLNIHRCLTRCIQYCTKVLKYLFAQYFVTPATRDYAQG